jgi:hypothetical protein
VYLFSHLYRYKKKRAGIFIWTKSTHTLCKWEMKWLRFFKRFLRRKEMTVEGTEKEVEVSCCWVLLQFVFLSAALLPCFLFKFSLISLHPFLFNLVTKNTRSPFLSSINLSCCFVMFFRSHLFLLIYCLWPLPLLV